MGDLITPVSLGLVHCQIGARKQILGVRRVFGKQSHAQTGRESYRLSVQNNAVLTYRLEQAVRRGQRRVAVRVGNEDGEFIPAEARNHVGVPHPAAQQTSEAHEELVAGPMAQSIVQELEFVEIDKQHRPRDLVPHRFRKLAFQLFVKAFAPQKVGQRVVVCYMDKLFLEALPLADVPCDGG